MALEVRWRNAGVDEWEQLRVVPAVNGGFTERGQYCFRLPPGAFLFVDDAPVAHLPGSDEPVWVPGFFAGEVTAEVVVPETGARETYSLDVSPDGNKVGREIFSRMLDDLWQDDPALVLGSEPAQALTGNAGVIRDPWLAFARFRRHAPDYLRALDQVRRSPRRRLRVARASVAPSAVRRVDRATATGLYRTSAITLFAATVTVPDTSNLRFDVPVTEETLDSAANRCLCALTRAMLGRARSLLVELGQRVEKEVESDTRTALIARWPLRRGQLETLIAQLVAVLRRSPLCDVTRPEVTAAGLTAIAADPAYASAWRSGWRAMRDGADLSSEPERMWLSPSWEIYERWCYVALRKALGALTPGWEWKRGNTGGSWTVSGPGVDGELLLQPTFRAGPAENRLMWSVSREREPDIVFKIVKNGTRRFVVFDAKYRASRANVLEAMASAHIYQDSLRIGGDRPAGSLLLVPAAGGAPWLESPEFQGRHRVGISIMAPGREVGLPAFVTELLTATGLVSPP